MDSRYFTVADWSLEQTDAYGNEWSMLGDPDGWDAPPDATGDFEQRDNADGAFDADVDDAARVLTFTGQVRSRDLAGMAAARKQVGTLARLFKRTQQIVGYYEDGNYTVSGKRSASWQASRIAPLVLRYQMVITCPDSFKYGPERSVSANLPSRGTGGLTFPLFAPDGVLDFGTPGDPGQMTLVNPGNADAWPVFTVLGPVIGGFTLTDLSTGRRLVYSDDVPAGGSVLVVDSADGSASLNGADRTGRLTTKQWFPVPASEDTEDPYSGIALEDAVLTQLDDTSAKISSPSLQDLGDGVGQLLVAGQEGITVQFSTTGAPGQSGSCTASFKPTYE